MSASSAPLRLQPLTTHLASWWQGDRPRLLHATKTCIALVLALWVCMRLNLAPPRTATVSVVILMMHQHVGMVIARGVYRGIGMLVGCLAGLVLIAAFAQQPLVFFIALAAWLAVCVYGAAYYRNYQSYGFVLTGYATAIVAIPAWSAPYAVFDNVVHTASEVVIGVVAAALVSALLFPLHVKEALFALGHRHASTFIGFIRNSLHWKINDAQPQASRLHLQLLGERAQIEQLRSAAIFEDPALRLGAPLMASLSHDFLDTAAGFHMMRQIRARAERTGAADALAAIDALFETLYVLLPAPGGDGRIPLDEVRTLALRLDALVHALPATIARLRSTHVADTDTEDAFAAAASALYFAVGDLRAYLRSFIAIRDRPTQPDRANPPRRTRILSTANAMAASAAGLRAAISVLLVAWLWVASGWSGGGGAVIATAITSALFAVLPFPAKASKHIFLGCLAGWLAAFVFDSFVLPRLDGFALLALAIAPVIFLGSYLGTFPKFAVFGLGFNIYFCFISNINNPHQYDPMGLLDTGFAMLIGIGVASLSFSILVPYAGDWVTARYLTQIRALVARTATRAPVSPTLLLHFESSMRDFILQAMGRPEEGRIGRKQLMGWAFASMEVGRAIIQIREASQQHAAQLPPRWPAARRNWTRALAELFERPGPDAHQNALAATRAALEALPRLEQFNEAPLVLATFRIRALLRSVELTLTDEELPIHASASSPLQGQTHAA
ncbi:FUSC family protein [Stenotrophomonas sp.]|uniref:FUSC family protein n=1 Tax=Stenotrophomonas sp. TaxID=69392 RepID=UPI0028A82A31|nr:FUSC family protein [Stenotrophomonas sp.]